MNTWRIVLRGQVNVGELNAMSPHTMTRIEDNLTRTIFTICTDQSGMVGLLRHLHNLGLVIESAARMPLNGKTD